MTDARSDSTTRDAHHPTPAVRVPWIAGIVIALASIIGSRLDEGAA